MSLANQILRIDLSLSKRMFPGWTIVDFEPREVPMRRWFVPHSSPPSDPAYSQTPTESHPLILLLPTWRRAHLWLPAFVLYPHYPPRKWWRPCWDSSTSSMVECSFDHPNPILETIGQFHTRREMREIFQSMGWEDDNNAPLYFYIAAFPRWIQ